MKDYIILNEKGIQVTAGAIIRNNIVINALYAGISIQANQGSYLRSFSPI